MEINSFILQLFYVKKKIIIKAGWIKKFKNIFKIGVNHNFCKTNCTILRLDSFERLYTSIYSIDKKILEKKLSGKFSK